MPSELTRLIREIDTVALAMNRAMYGLAGNYARHDFINARYKLLDDAYIQLVPITGETIAKETVLKVMDDAARVACEEHEAENRVYDQEEEKYLRLIGARVHAQEQVCDICKLPGDLIPIRVNDGRILHIHRECNYSPLRYKPSDNSIKPEH